MTPYFLFEFIFWILLEHWTSVFTAHWLKPGVGQLVPRSPYRLLTSCTSLSLCLYFTWGDIIVWSDCHLWAKSCTDVLVLKWSMMEYSWRYKSGCQQCSLSWVGTQFPFPSVHLPCPSLRSLPMPLPPPSEPNISVESYFFSPSMEKEFCLWLWGCERHKWPNPWYQGV